MKKGLIFVLFALVSIVSYSQISWNAKVGMNMSNFTGDADTDMRVGFNVGVGMEYQFTDMWSIQPSLTHLPVCRKQFIQALKTPSLPVRNPVIREIPECHHLRPGRQLRRIGRRMVRTVQNHIRLPCLHGRLPDIIPIIVFQFPQCLHRSVIQHPVRLLPIRGFQRIKQIHHIIKGDIRCCDGHPFRSSARSIENTCR